MNRLDKSTKGSMLASMKALSRQLMDFRMERDLSYEGLSKEFARAGYEISSGTLFSICTAPDKPMLDRTRYKIEQFLKAQRQIA